MDEINTLQRQRDQVGEGKSLCLRRFISMCGWKRAADAKWTGQNEDLMRYPSYRDAVGLDGGAIEFERKNFPGFTTLTTGKKEHRAGEFQRPDHLCLWITTSSGKGMMRIASRTPRNSRIAQTRLNQDVVGLSWVEVRKRDGTVAHLMDHATVQPTKWYSNEKKLVILFSLPPVLWVAEVWSEEMAKVPFTLMEISWTRNYYFKTIKSVNQVSIYAAATNWCYNFALKKEEHNTFLHPWTIELWLLWKPKKWICWYILNLAQGNLMMQSELKFRVLEKKVRSLIPVSCHSRKSLPISARWRRRIVTNHTFMQRIYFFSSLHTSQATGSYSSRHNCWTDLWGSNCENSWRTWSGSGDSINLQTWRRDLRCDIQRETERFVNVIHTHEAKTRFSRKILQDRKKACLTNKER